MKNKPICIIPARGGSKRLKGKNKAMFMGKPLVEHAILTAIESKLFLHIIVSSDDEEILEIAYKHFNDGLVQPHMRPPLLSGDEAELKHVCRQIILAYHTNSHEFCMLIPNSPLRTAKDIRNTYRTFKKEEANYLITVKPALPGLIINKGYLRQIKTDIFHEDGAICWANTQVFFNEFNKDFFGTKCLPYILPHPTVEIHTKKGLQHAEQLGGRDV